MLLLCQAISTYFLCSTKLDPAIALGGAISSVSKKMKINTKGKLSKSPSWKHRDCVQVARRHDKFLSVLRVIVTPQHLLNAHEVQNYTKENESLFKIIVCQKT